MHVEVPPYFPDAEEVRDEILDYYYEIQHFDAHLARMLDKLEELGELDNTIVVVTSDNGMPFVRTKTTLYDGGVRMPLAIRWGERAPAGRTIDDFVSHADFAATFLEAAGVEAPATVTGRSLLPLLETERDGRVEEPNAISWPWASSGILGAGRGAPAIPAAPFGPTTTSTSATTSPTAGPTAIPISSHRTRRPTATSTTVPFKDFMLRPEIAPRFSPRPTR